ncbi:hypothetical protein CPB86DRAFT_720041, partial [Serendipita vermifera]
MDSTKHITAETDRLSSRDLLDMQLLAHNIRHNQSRASLTELGDILAAHNVPISSPYLMKKKLEDFSGLTAKVYHCCINSCVCFTGPLSSEQKCPVCEQPRLDSHQQPRKKFMYLPLIPRLQSFFKSPELIDQLTYRTSLGAFDGIYRDVFDSEHFRQLLNRNVTIEGKTYSHKIGQFATDVFLTLTLDGVALYRGIGAQRSKFST